MSIRALTYARECLRRDTTLGTPARLVFMLLADSCNHATGLAFTGQWLADQAGIHERNVTRALATLRESGYVRFEDRPGRATVVTFPTAAYLSTTPDENVRGEHTRAGDDFVTRPPAKTSPIPGSVPAYINSSNNLDVVAREALCCDGTGWIYNADTNDVSPCPLHHPRGKAVGS